MIVFLLDWCAWGLNRLKWKHEAHEALAALAPRTLTSMSLFITRTFSVQEPTLRINIVLTLQYT